MQVTRGLGAQLVVGAVVPTLNVDTTDGGLALARHSQNDGVRLSYLPPSIHHISPNTGPAGGHVVVAIYGTNLATGFLPSPKAAGALTVKAAGNETVVSGSVVGETMLARANQLVGTGNLSDALNEYLRRVLTG